MDSETVLGHYVANATGQWAPALQQSTELFKAIVNDDINSFEEEYKALGSGSLGAFTILYWSEGKADQASPQVQAKARNLLSLAVFHGALRVISFLLSKGANPRTGQDGQSAYEVRSLSRIRRWPDRCALLSRIFLENCAIDQRVRARRWQQLPTESIVAVLCVPYAVHRRNKPECTYDSGYAGRCSRQLCCARG